MAIFGICNLLKRIIKIITKICYFLYAGSVVFNLLAGFRSKESWLSELLTPPPFLSVTWANVSSISMPKSMKMYVESAKGKFQEFFTEKTTSYDITTFCLFQRFALLVRHSQAKFCLHPKNGFLKLHHFSLFCYI